VSVPTTGKSNFDALFSGGRILSSYPIDPAKPCKGFESGHGGGKNMGGFSCAFT
jgi:hypothetical protein